MECVVGVTSVEDPREHEQPERCHRAGRERLQLSPRRRRRRRPPHDCGQRQERRARIELKADTEQYRDEREREPALRTRDEQRDPGDHEQARQGSIGDRRCVEGVIRGQDDRDRHRDYRHCAPSAPPRGGREQHPAEPFDRRQDERCRRPVRHAQPVQQRDRNAFEHAAVRLAVEVRLAEPPVYPVPRADP